MPKLLRWLAPKEKKFFEMFAEQSENALEGANELRKFVKNFAKLERRERKSKADLLKEIGAKGGEITNKIMENLRETFVKPIDKEDFHRITVLLDDTIDLLNIVAQRLVLLGIERIDDHILKLADIANSAVKEMYNSISELKKLRSSKEHYTKIHTLENEADDAFGEALSELFRYYKNPIDIIRYREIYELMERITDKCEDIAHVIESVAARYD